MGVRVDRLDREPDGRAAGGGMSGYLLAFEIISIHLVVVLIGAAYLARAETRRVGHRAAARNRRSPCSRARRRRLPDPNH